MIDEINKYLFDWYALNKRDLPWRHTKDPYKIWLSEIILQQTRVKQGLKYYEAFVTTYPTVVDFAHAPLDNILLLWQGLGYYSRARNMHVAANEILNNYNGEFPSSYDQLINLKGVGDYTASAIASFAFDEKKGVLDGNVYRVLSRIFGEQTEINSSKAPRVFKEWVNKLLPRNNTAIFNQAIMEFGALHCTPKKPNCVTCDISQLCYAFKHNMQNEIPRKKKAAKVKKRYFYYFLIHDADYVFLHKRSAGEIWEGLYEFYLIESATVLTTEQAISRFFEHEKNFVDACKVKILKQDQIHKLSHQEIHADLIEIKCDNLLSIDNKEVIKIEKSELNNYAKPILMQNFLEESKI